jgi:transposase InsO family protein
MDILLKRKSEVLNCFKDFKAIVEKQSSYKIRTVRSDQGEEYTSNDFEAFCTQQGIRHQTTPAYILQLNGAGERKNQMILNMARSLLKAKKLPKQYWAEVVSCAVYLLNRCPTRSMEGFTPEEAWSGYKPNVTHL